MAAKCPAIKISTKTPHGAGGEDRLIDRRRVKDASNLLA
jgi:hypothetical protein